ncbi:MAG: hypothetical protein KC414_11730, partial [Romboutsia sp.]|nr:hypothetical protein [Romboutsia sp.]
MKYVVSIIVILVGIIFILSGAFKIFPIEPFEYQLVSIKVANWNTVSYISRIFIGLELVLGIFLVFHILLKRFTIKATLLMLIVFSIYLTITIIKEGNEGDCGCMGVYVQMTPLQALIKNIVCIVLLVFSYFNIKKTYFLDNYAKFIVPLFTVILMALPFIVYPITNYSSNFANDKVDYRLDWDLLYKDQDFPPKIDLTKGKHIICFFSLSCPHCEEAAIKVNIMHQQNPAIPFYLVLNGKHELQDAFFKKAKIEDIPYCYFKGVEK